MSDKSLVCVVMAGALLAAGGCRRVLPAQVEAAASAATTETKSTAVPMPPGRPAVRATGTIQAARAYTVQVPQIAGLPSGPAGRLTLVKLLPNGTKVQAGQVIAEFDQTTQLDAAREAQAKFEDLSHQVKQTAAQHRSDQEKRISDLREAEAELARAQIQLRKGPVLSEIDRLKNEERARAAEARVGSLKKIDALRRQAEAAALRIIELQSERQKVVLERARRNSEKLVIKASIAGMVALETLWRGGSMGNAQEGDQLFPGNPLFKIFDPSEMLVQVLIAEPDGASLKPGTTAMVSLDAYPDTAYRAHFESASPVATSALGSPIKNFTARFILEQQDPRLLPDLSAAVVIQPEPIQPEAAR